MKLTCTECSLSKVGCVSGSGATPAEIMIVVDRPSLADINAGQAFTGKVGKQLREYLTISGIQEEKVYFTHVVKGYVKPGKNISIVSIRKCVVQLKQELEVVKPKVLILMGAAAYKAVRGKSAPGTAYFDDELGCWVVYTFHPLKPMISGQDADFSAILAAFTQAKGLVTKDKGTKLEAPAITIVRTQEELTALLPTLSQQPILGVDCETTGLNPYQDKLLTIGLSSGSVNVGVIFTPELAPTLTQLLNSVKFLGHNVKFDLQFLAANGIKIKAPYMDTMLGSYVLEPQATSRDLASQCLKEFQTSFDKNIDYPALYAAGITPEILTMLAERGTLDAFLTYKLMEVQLSRLSQTQEKFLFQVVMPICSLLTEIETNGLRINKTELFATATVVEYKLKSLVSDIQAMPEVQAFAKKKGLAEINFGSPKQMSELIYKHLKITPDKEEGETTKKEVLEKLGKAQPNPVLEKLLEFRNVDKLYDTYIKGIQAALSRSPTDRIHVNYSQDRVVTGRLSCFPAGTLVRAAATRKNPTRGGKSSEYVPIETLCVGDRVFTHLGKACTITKTMVNQYSGELVKIVLPWRGLPNIPRTIYVTPDHPFLTDRGWIRAGDITEETTLYTYQDIMPTYKSNMQHTRHGGPRAGTTKRYFGTDPEVHARAVLQNTRTYTQKYGTMAKSIAAKCVSKMHSLIVRGPIVRGAYHQAAKLRPGLLKSASHTCAKCGETFKNKKLVIHHKDGDTRNNNPQNLQVLCYKCHNNHHKHPGTTQPQYKTKFSGVVKSTVLARDQHKCTRCGSIKNLCVHHISQRDGVTLCAKCHAKVHHGHPLEVNGIHPLLISRVNFRGPVYNLSVLEAESYFVQGVIAHNCSAPNLQTIPNKKSVDNADLIRKMFCAEEGRTLLEMDFKQLEFRVWGHMSRDSVMLQMIQGGGDIHKKMAAKINGITEDQVSDEQRYQAKEISFGLMYGMGTASLAARTKLTIEQATKIKDDFFTTFPDATVWLQQVADFGLTNQYVTTPFGRRIPIVYNPNDKEDVSSAKRRAVNYPIQSTAAELTNIVGCIMFKAIEEQKIPARIVLNVHDSLVWEVALGHEQAVKQVALQAIQEVVKMLSFRAVLEASFKAGPNLAEQTEL